MPFLAHDGTRTPSRPSVAVLGRPTGSGESWEPTCMSRAEYDGWLDAAALVPSSAMHGQAERVCADCPASWRDAALAAGRCNELEA